MGREKDITGIKYNRLTALRFSHWGGEIKIRHWLFKCECGKEKTIGKQGEGATFSEKEIEKLLYDFLYKHF